MLSRGLKISDKLTHTALASRFSDAKHHKKSQITRHDTPHYLLSRRYDATGTPAFGRSSDIVINSEPLVPEKMYLALQLTAAISGTSAPQLEPLSTVVSSVELRYRGNTLIRADSAQLVAEKYVLKEHDDFIKAAWGEAAIPDTQAVLRNTVNTAYFLDLDMFTRMMKHLPPLSSFPSNAFTFRVTLEPLNQSASGSDAVAAVATVSELYIILQGNLHDETSVRKGAEMVREGLSVHFLAAQYFTQDIAAVDTSATVTFSNIKGRSPFIVFMARDATPLRSTVPSVLDKDDWRELLSTTGTYSFGTVASRDLVTGRPTSLAFAKYGYPGLPGAPIKYDGVLPIEVGIYVVPLTEDGKISEDFGVDTGWYAFNFQERLIIEGFTAPGEIVQLDVLVYIEQVLTIDAAKANVSDTMQMSDRGLIR